MTDTPTAVVPLAVVPRELLERALDAAETGRHLTNYLARNLGGVCLQPGDPLSRLVTDLRAALAAAGGRP